MPDWDFLTSHARVLLAIANDPDLRLREIAAVVGISERRAFGIVRDLTRSGYVAKEKRGRRNRYDIRAHRPLWEGADHPTIGDVLDLLTAASAATTATDRPTGEHRP